MPFGTEPEQVGNRLKVTNQPVGPKNAASKGSVGDTALMDAVAIVVGAWIVVFLIAFSLRRHNA
jgi:hypothetical protein